MGEPEEEGLRSQIFRGTQVTPDIQIIIHPSDAPEVDVTAVYGIRFRLVF